MASYSSPNSLVQPPPPRGASSLRRRSPYARTTDTPLDAAIRHFCAAAVPEPRARRGRATGGAARRSAVAIAMAGEATGGACWASTGPCAAGVAPCCGWRRKRHDALFAFPENTHVDWARRTMSSRRSMGVPFLVKKSQLVSPRPRVSPSRTHARPTRVPPFDRRRCASACHRSRRKKRLDFLRARSKTRFEGFRVWSTLATRGATSSNLRARRRLAPPPPPRLTSPATCARTARPSS